MVKCLPEFEYLPVFLKNKNIIFKIRRSKITDYRGSFNMNRLNTNNSDIDGIIKYMYSRGLSTLVCRKTLVFTIYI